MELPKNFRNGALASMSSPQKTKRGLREERLDQRATFGTDRHQVGRLREKFVEVSRDRFIEVVPAAQQSHNFERDILSAIAHAT
jgi:hypothetical protein